MKKILLLAAVAATVFASCKSDKQTEEPVDKVLSVRLVNPPLLPSSRAIENPTATTGLTVEDGNGIIFITDAAGSVRKAIPFASTFPVTQTSQVVANVSATDKVFVLANIGLSNVTDWTTSQIPANVDAIKELTMSIANVDHGQNYAQATLSNFNGSATDLDVVGSNATAVVVISPAYSRIELLSVKGEDGGGSRSITGFDVVGVYVDDYYNLYKMGGSFGGVIHSQGQNTIYGGIGEMQDSGTWTAVGSVASPGSSAWVYSVPSGNLPRLIIKLDNVSGTFENGGAINPTQEYFLTVTEYTPTIINFVRGKVYKIAEVKFNPDNLKIEPNPKKADLSVTLDVTQWEIANIGTVLAK